MIFEIFNLIILFIGITLGCLLGWWTINGTITWLPHRNQKESKK